jgi:uncharacterized protein (TIGR03000 family)
VLPEQPGGVAIPPPTGPAQTEPAVEPPGKTPEPPAEAPPSTSNIRENSGLLTIYVPYDAKIEVNGLPTRSEGSRRQYVSYGLKPGFSYKYVIRAEATVRVKQDPDDANSPMIDRLVQEKLEVVLTAGDRQMVTFGFNPTPTQAVASR